jgi:prepilin-type N-terminal cleavage/methylation domain-containing protein
MRRSLLRLQKRCCEERGFGLIELLVVLSLLGAIIGATLIVFTSALGSESDLTQRVRAQEQARLALERMRRDVHCASGIVVETHSTTSVTLNISSACPSALGASQVTWCTDTTGTTRRLYRVNGPTCTGGIVWAEHLTPDPTSAPGFTRFFAYTPSSAASLAIITIDFPVDLDPGDALRAYRLRDSLTLRNSTRSP